MYINIWRRQRLLLGLKIKRSGSSSRYFNWRELGRDEDEVTLESGCQILLDTRYIAPTSDTRGNNWGLFDQGKITPHNEDIIWNLKRICGERSCNLLKGRINLIFIHFVLLSFNSETEFRILVKLYPYSQQKIVLQCYRVNSIEKFNLF